MAGRQRRTQVIKAIICPNKEYSGWDYSRAINTDTTELAGFQLIVFNAYKLTIYFCIKIRLYGEYHDPSQYPG